MEFTPARDGEGTTLNGGISLVTAYTALSFTGSMSSVGRHVPGGGYHSHHVVIQAHAPEELPSNKTRNRTRRKSL